MTASQITQTITDPGVAPARTDPDNFDSRADSFLAVFSIWAASGTGELNVWTTQVNALSTNVNDNATAAALSATTAEAAASAAETAAGATEWVVGTTYDEGDVTWGSDYLSYRSAQDSNLGHNPVGDDGTWWVKIGAVDGALPTALAVADLNDPTTPSVLTVGETTNKTISNYKTSGADHVFIVPAAHIYGSVIFVIGDEFQVDIEPDSGENFYLNGTAMAADEHIQNTSDTLGEELVGYVANINGILTWMFRSSSSNFVQETP